MDVWQLLQIVGNQGKKTKRMSKRGRADELESKTGQSIKKGSSGKKIGGREGEE